MHRTLTVLCFGDVVGKPGRHALRDRLPDIRKTYAADFVIVNGENAAGGVGFDEKCAEELKAFGVDLITLGDHRWDRNGTGEFMSREGVRCIRPANTPAGAPGRGWHIWQSPDGIKVGVFNLLGRVFTQALVDCPFHCADEILSNELKDCQIKICDVHAEATSEKAALFWHMDGRVSLAFGTHTHVQTADERLLPRGSACITDLGMCGGRDSIIGMQPEAALRRFTTGLATPYKLADGPVQLRGIVCRFAGPSFSPEVPERLVL